MDRQWIKTPNSGSKYLKKTVVKRRVVSSPKSPDGSDSSVYVYEEDWWEMPGAAVSDSKPLSPTAPPAMSQTNDPKTDYTYSRSPSYSRKYTDEGYVSPNMSRRRLREDMDSMLSVLVSPGSSKSPATKHTMPVNTHESYLSTSQNTHNTHTEHHREHHTEHHTDRREVTPGKATYNYYSELSEHELRLRRSATRSGCKYGQSWVPGSKSEQLARSRTELQNDVEEDEDSDYSVELNDVETYRSAEKRIDYAGDELNDVETYRSAEKRIDYAGDESLLKERTLKHIYGAVTTNWRIGAAGDLSTVTESPSGLDREADFSDNEVEESVLERRNPHITDNTTVHKASTLYTVYTLISTLITTTFTAVTSKTYSFVREGHANVVTGTAVVGTCLKNGLSSTLYTGSRVVTYPFCMLYSLLIALLGYLWQAVGWICYDVWVGDDKYVARIASGNATAAAYDSSSNTENETTTTKTTTTTTITTVTKTLTEQDEYGEDEMDGGALWRKEPVTSSRTGIRADSWLTRMLKTMIVTTTYMLLLPVTAAKGAVSGAASTTKWLLGGDEHLESEPALTVKSESASDSMVSHQESGALTRRRRSKPSRSVMESTAAHSAAVSSSEESVMTWFMKRSTSTLCTLLWLPLGLCIGVGRMVTRPVYYVTGLVGMAYTQDAPVEAQSAKLFSERRVHDEDKDTDTSVEYKSDAIATRAIYSATHKSRLLVVMETVQDAILWPIAALFACCRFCWSTCSTCHWFVGHALSTALVGYANKLQRGLAKSVVTDTWLLSRTSRTRRAYGCCCWLIPILLIPLLLTCAYYAYDRGLLRSAVIPVVIPAPVPIATKETAQQAAAGALYTDAQLAAHVQTILIGLLRERETETRMVLSQDWRTWADEFAAGQSAAMTSHRADVDAALAALIKEQVLVAGVGKQEAEKQGAVLARQQEYIAALQKQISAIVVQSDGLRDQLVQARADMVSEDKAVRVAGAAAVASLEGKLEQQGADLRHLQSSHGALAAAFKDCCKNDSVLALMVRKGVEEHLAAMLGGGGSGTLPMGGPGAASSHPTFLTWLHKQFVGRDDMDSRLAALLSKIEDEIRVTSSEAQNAAALAAAAAAAAKTSTQESEKSKKTEKMTLVAGAATGGVTEKHVQMLIQQALMLYSADKTGKVDYALESAGGSVVSTRCSETYHRRTAQLSLFGIPLWYTSNSPRTVIQPDMQPGQCWAFRGDQGYLVIQMASLVRLTAFTMEHIPKALSPTGKIDSAPKDFTVMGLLHDRDRDGTFLGNFTYSEEGEPLQTFLVTEPVVQSFAVVELQINSNHGNKEYTCLYRFRVHGVLDL